jgi:ABC-type branched-subunit amino acid transport system substrate-binding protein
MIRARFLAAPLASLAVLAACGSGDGGGAATTAAPATEAPATTAAAGTEAPATTAAAGTEAPATTGAPAGFTVDTSKCSDPAAVEAPIEGTVKIGTVLPLSGTPAIAFKPVAEGLQLYYDYANANNLLPGYKIELSIEDDQYNATLTSPAVEKLIDQTGVNMFSGIIGSPNNLAVRDLLNGDCYPQLNALTGYPGWGDYENYPWTTGALVPYNDETQIYADAMKTLYPDGGKVALFYVNNEFGQAYADTFKKIAADYNFEVVDEQTIEAEDSNPPTSQVTSIASKKPDIVLAAPLGLQCPAFLKEMTNAEAANAGWTPAIFQTNTCASKLFLGLAGAAADGVYTSANLKDPNDPKNAADPGVKPFLDLVNASGSKSDPGVIAAGWSVAESTVEVLKKAAASAEGLTRKSILEAARSESFAPSLFREGLSVETSPTDGYPVESLQVLQWQNASQTFKEIGSPITTYEGKTTFSG